MKEITTYIAYDDQEFDTREECEAYEQDAREMVKEAIKVYSFFDKDMNLFTYNGDFSSPDSIEEFLEWFDRITDKSIYVKVNGTPSRGLHRFLYRNTGVLLPSDEEGFYKYDYNTFEWVRMD